ncbi:uncharacterized protein LOC143568511 [Bidens hawaiensis]|uniref:uncharacterized protein LOC143568511 n=1 Tax=Bidens hawaiensis TaxID=980011 RepID=UPI00404B3571
MTNTALLRPIIGGPHKPVTQTPEGPVNTTVETYGDEDKELLQEDEKAYGILSVSLSAVIAQTLREQTSTKELWDALVEKFEGNLEMRNSRKEMLKGEFNMFNHSQGETVSILIGQFEKLITKMRSVGIVNEPSKVNHKLLKSLPYTWHTSAITIIRTTKLKTLSIQNLVS